MPGSCAAGLELEIGPAEVHFGIVKDNIQRVPVEQSSPLIKVLVRLFILVSVVLSFQPLPQIFSGVDTTVTGIRPDSSAYVRILLVSILPWLGLSFLMAADDRRSATSVVLNCAPLVFLIISASLSLAWTVNEYDTLKSTILLCIYVFIAASMVSLLGYNQSMELLFYAILIVCTASLAWVFLAPESGIHHATDYGARHPGLWRGVFAHKNLLGQAAAMLAVTSVMLSTSPQLLRGLGLVLSVILLVNAQSSSSIAVAAIGVSCWFFIAANPLWRAGILFLALVAVLAAEAAEISVFDVLITLLGRDDTLTGRTGVWVVAIPEIQRNLPYGLGFGAIEEFNSKLFSASGDKVLNVHNSFLEILLSLGAFGVAVITLIIMTIVRWTFAPAAVVEGNWRAPYVVGICWLIAGLSETSPFQPGNIYFFAGSLSLLMLSDMNKAERALSAADYR